MSDLNQNLNIVAREIVAALPENIAWGDYPDIGEHDWEAVLAELERITAPLRPDTDAYLAAYEALSDRVDKEAI